MSRSESPALFSEFIILPLVKVAPSEKEPIFSRRHYGACVKLRPLGTALGLLNGDRACHPPS
jgi:hypothetical protein